MSFREAELSMWSGLGVAAPRDRTVALRRSGVTVRLQELGEGEPIVFIHGASSSGAVWAELVTRLDGFRCILLDRPGCGLSPPLKRSVDDLDHLRLFAEAMVVDVLDALNLETAHLVGTSFGGYFAVRTAAAHPERVRRVVELGWFVGAPITKVPFVMRLASAPGVAALQRRVKPSERLIRAMLKQIGVADPPQHVITTFLSTLRDTDTMRNELKAGPKLITPIRGMNRRVLLSDEVFAAVHAPMLLLWGELDPFGGPETARLIASKLPTATLEVLAGSGHAVWIDRPGHVAARVQEFLTENR